MQIIAGYARGIQLATVPTLAVRPTAGRARKALFDSLGNFDGATVVDLCAGSGALGLEAASRGAAEVFLIERDRRHARLIEKNIAAVTKAGAPGVIHLVEGDMRDVRSWRGARPEAIFADPPYPDSAELFGALMRDPAFIKAAAGALVIWELPDLRGESGKFFEVNPLVDFRVRNFGGTEFLIGTMQEGEA